MFFPLLAATVALVLQNPSSAPPLPPLGETASAVLFSADGRLTQKVTFAAPSITINEALKQVTTQTGIPTKMRDSKILGEERVCIYAEAIPAQQFLESVAALLRYKNITSEWQKDASGDGYALSVGGQYYASAALKAKEADQPKFILTNISPDGTASGPIDPSAAGVVVTPSSDGKNVTVTVTKKATGTATPASSAPITFKVQAAPTITVNGQKVASNSDTSGIKPKKPVADDWFTRYDNRTNMVEGAAFPANEGTTTAPAPNTLANLLAAIAHQQRISVIALLPNSLQKGDAAPLGISATGKTVALFLTGLTNAPLQFSHKWHKGALLLRDPVAPFK